MDKLFYGSYMLWMIAGVVGFPLSVGWLFFRKQKLRQAKSEYEKNELLERVRTAWIFVGLFLIALIGFLILSATPYGQRALSGVSG